MMVPSGDRLRAPGERLAFTVVSRATAKRGNDMLAVFEDGHMRDAQRPPDLTNPFAGLQPTPDLLLPVGEAGGQERQRVWFGGASPPFQQRQRHLANQLALHVRIGRETRGQRPQPPNFRDSFDHSLFPSLAVRNPPTRGPHHSVRHQDIIHRPHDRALLLRRLLFRGEALDRQPLPLALPRRTVQVRLGEAAQFAIHFRTNLIESPHTG